MRNAGYIIPSLIDGISYKVAAFLSKEVNIA